MGPPHGCASIFRSYGLFLSEWGEFIHVHSYILKTALLAMTSSCFNLSWVQILQVCLTLLLLPESPVDREGGSTEKDG